MQARLGKLHAKDLQQNGETMNDQVNQRGRVARVANIGDGIIELTIQLPVPAPKHDQRDRAASAKRLKEDRRRVAAMVGSLVAIELETERLEA